MSVMTITPIWFHPSVPRQCYESEAETETGERKQLDDVFIEWIIYADSAAPRTGRMTMKDIGLLIPCD